MLIVERVLTTIIAVYIMGKSIDVFSSYLNRIGKPTRVFLFPASQCADY